MSHFATTCKQLIEAGRTVRAAANDARERQATQYDIQNCVWPGVRPEVLDACSGAIVALGDSCPDAVREAETLQVRTLEDMRRLADVLELTGRLAT